MIHPNVNILPDSSTNLSKRLSPGEETCFGNGYVLGITCSQHTVTFVLPTSPDYWDHSLRGASAVCDSQGKGVLAIKNFGFEYSQIVEEQTLTKREVGPAPLLVKCTGAT